MSWVLENMTRSKSGIHKGISQKTNCHCKNVYGDHSRSCREYADPNYDDYLKNNYHILCIECRQADGIQACLSECKLGI